MNRVAFVVTKPIQLINALNIIQQFEFTEKADLLIVDNFSDSIKVFERIRATETDGRRSFFVKDRNELFKLLINQEYEQIFIDSDVGIKNFRFMQKIRSKNRSVTFSVYEEGVGTYRDDLYSRPKRIIYDSLGVGAFFGGCILTSTIYVYEPDLYHSRFPSLSKHVEKITTPIFDLISHNNELFKDIFSLNIDNAAHDDNENCYIYLSSWTVSEDFLRYFNELDGNKFVKFHPAIRGQGEFVEEARTVLVPNRVPAELLIVSVEGQFKKVTVFHEGSSTSKYVNRENIHFVDLSELKV